MAEAEAPAVEAPVAVVTGAAGGIGSAVVTQLVGDGWRVVAVDGPGPIVGVEHRLSTPQDLVASASIHPTVETVAGDVRRLVDCERAVTRALQSFGRIDALITAAGVLPGGTPVAHTPDAAWDAAWEVNVMGVVNLIRAGVDHLPEGRGRVVALASAAAGRAHPRLGAYTASKAALVGVVRAAAAELGPRGITVNAVSPGATATPLLDASANVYELADATDFSIHHLIERLVEPAEVAATVGFLVSPAASGITGAVLPVDGGMSA